MARPPMLLKNDTCTTLATVVPWARSLTTGCSLGCGEKVPASNNNRDRDSVVQGTPSGATVLSGHPGRRETIPRRAPGREVRQGSSQDAYGRER